MEIDGLLVDDDRFLYNHSSGLNLGSPRGTASVNGDDLVQKPAGYWVMLSSSSSSSSSSE